MNSQKRWRYCDGTSLIKNQNILTTHSRCGRFCCYLFLFNHSIDNEPKRFLSFFVFGVRCAVWSKWFCFFFFSFSLFIRCRDRIPKTDRIFIIDAHFKDSSIVLNHRKKKRKKEEGQCTVHRPDRVWECDESSFFSLKFYIFFPSSSFASSNGTSSTISHAIDIQVLVCFI